MYMCMCMSQHRCAGRRSVCGSQVSSSMQDQLHCQIWWQAPSPADLSCKACVSDIHPPNRSTFPPRPPPPVTFAHFRFPLLSAPCGVESGAGRGGGGAKSGGGADPRAGCSEVSQALPVRDENYSTHNASRSRDCVVARTGGLGASAPRNRSVGDGS